MYIFYETSCLPSSSRTLILLNFLTYFQIKLFIQHGHFKGEENYGHPFPEIDNRNQSQFWVFQNRESAIKCSIQPSVIDPKIDESFNLTLTYRKVEQKFYEK